MRPFWDTRIRFKDSKCAGWMKRIRVWATCYHHLYTLWATPYFLITAIAELVMPGSPRPPLPSTCPLSLRRLLTSAWNPILPNTTQLPGWSMATSTSSSPMQSCGAAMGGARSTFGACTGQGQCLCHSHSYFRRQALSLTMPGSFSSSSAPRNHSSGLEIGASSPSPFIHTHSYLARHYKLYGKDEKEMGLVDMIMVGGSGYVGEGTCGGCVGHYRPKQSTGAVGSNTDAQQAVRIAWARHSARYTNGDPHPSPLWSPAALPPAPTWFPPADHLLVSILVLQEGVESLRVKYLALVYQEKLVGGGGGAGGQHGCSLVVVNRRYGGV